MEDKEPEGIPMANPEFIATSISKEDKAKSSHKICFERKMGMVEKYIKKYGLSVSRRQFSKKIAEENNIGLRQVYKDWDWIIGNVKIENMRQIKLDLKIGRDRALEDGLFALNTINDPVDLMNAAEKMLHVVKLYREEMEAWGEKAPIPIETNVNINKRELNVWDIINAAKAARESQSGTAGIMEPERREDTH